MNILRNKQQLPFALAMIFVVGIFPCSHVWSQSGTTQGSGTSQGSGGRNPFQQSLDEGLDPGDFQLPGSPPLAGAGSAVQPQQSLQDIRVNEKFAGWRQASDGSDGNRLSNVIRSHWVMADETGKVSGIVYGVEGADIGNLTIFLLNNGREVTSTIPKEDGSFLFSNIRQGVYSIVGWGDNAFFAFGVNIVRFNQDFDDNVPTELKITAVQNETTINTDWIRFFAEQVKFRVYGTYVTKEEEAEDGDIEKTRLYGVEGQSLYLPASRPATSISSHQVIPASDGRVIGRVNQMTTESGRPVDLRNTRILLLKNDDVFAAVTTDSYGVFEFPEIPAGEYACVAVGQDGLGCIGIFLGEPAIDDEEFAPISFTMTTSETTGWINSLAIETAYQRVISRPRMPKEQPQPFVDSNGQMCSRPGGLRPGGYRPPAQRNVPREQRFLPRANRFIDNLFFRDNGLPPGLQGAGTGVGGNGGFANGGGGFNAPTGGGFGGSGTRTPAGSSSRNPEPGGSKR